MIDSGPQLAGSMEYNVVLSEYLWYVDTPISAYIKVTMMVSFPHFYIWN